MPNNQLTLVEKADLKTLKIKVTRGQDTWLEVGFALAEIRERKLYREESKSFEDFCRKNWGWGADRAYQLCKAVEFWQGQKLIADTTGEVKELPKSESEARKQQKAQQTDADKCQIEKPTPSTDKPISSPLSMARAKKPVIEDKIGWPIPDKLHDLWKRRDEPFDGVIRELKKAKNYLQAILANKDMMWVEVNFQSCFGDLDRLMTDIERARPYAVCPYCKGRSFDSCTVCNKRGLISEYLWRAGLNADKVFSMHKKEIETYQNGKAKDV